MVVEDPDYAVCGVICEKAIGLWILRCGKFALFCGAFYMSFDGKFSAGIAFATASFGLEDKCFIIRLVVSGYTYDENEGGTRNSNSLNIRFWYGVEMCVCPSACRWCRKTGLLPVVILI